MTGIDARIVELRKAGLSCRETAAQLAVTESRVWRAMKAAGLSGKLSVYHLDGTVPPKKRSVPRSRVETEDVAAWNSAELDDMEAWIAKARAGRLSLAESRNPEAYLRRMTRLVQIARRAG